MVKMEVHGNLSIMNLDLKLVVEIVLSKEEFGTEMYWIGVEMEYLKPIFPGDWLTSTRTLTNIYEKSGRSGQLIFYEVLMEVANDDGDLVVRDRRTTLMR